MKLHEVIQVWFDKLPEGSEWRPDLLLEWLGILLRSMYLFIRATTRT